MESVFIHVDYALLSNGRAVLEKKDKNPRKYQKITHRPPSAHLAQDKIPFSSVEKGLKTFRIATKEKNLT